MRHRGWLVAGWATATMLAVVVGLLGVSAVSDSVVGGRRSVLSQSSVRAALDRHASSSASSSDDSTESESSADLGEDSSQSTSTAASSGSATTNPPPGTSASSSSEGSEGEDSGSDDSQSAAGAIDETYSLIGGTVSVRFENGAAHLLFASPAAGYEIDDDGGNDESVDIRFRSDSHESRLRAFWSNGPQHEIEEKDD